MVDLETWRLEEGGVNVRFVNNFPERRWSPNVSIIMPARLDRARNYSYLSFHHLHHFLLQVATNAVNFGKSI